MTHIENCVDNFTGELLVHIKKKLSQFNDQNGITSLHGYISFTDSLHFQVMESHQANKKDISGTANAVISCFQKLGVDFDMDQVSPHLT